MLRARVQWPEGAKWMIFRGKTVEAAAANTVYYGMDVKSSDPNGAMLTGSWT